jgi:hypothetical protein
MPSAMHSHGMSGYLRAATCIARTNTKTWREAHLATWQALIQANCAFITTLREIGGQRLWPMSFNTTVDVESSSAA